MSRSQAALNTVLVVDDDRIHCAVATSFFKSRGTLDVHVAENGDEALEIVRDSNGGLDFILCDLNMPKLDGVQFLRCVKQYGYEGPIAILSGLERSVISVAAELAEIHSLNVVGALHKPLNFRQLDHVLAEFERQSVFCPDDDTAEIADDELRAALAQGAITAHYQPIVDIVTGKVVSTEAFACWDHPEHGLLGAEVLAPLADKAGLSGAFTGALLRQALEDAKRFRRLRIKCRTALRLSASELENIDLPDTLVALVDARDGEPSDLVWEITDLKNIQQSAVAMEVIARLRLSGFEIAADNFGTSLTKRSQITDFPLSELKLDPSVVKNAAHDGCMREELETSLALAKELDLRVVARGVDCVEDHDFLARRKVAFEQGTYVSAPLPIEMLLLWLFDGAKQG